MKQVLDITAKLLATENITVTRANTDAASFDIKSRILTLPLLKDTTKDIETMFVAHEVGHALYTPVDLLDRKHFDIPFGYINIVEDARIEKLIKRKYPGLRKEMSSGYDDIMNTEYFSNLNPTNLIDRINLWFKLGTRVDVEFSPQEQVFVDRVAKLEMYEDVIPLAREIYEFSKQELIDEYEQNSMPTIADDIAAPSGKSVKIEIVIDNETIPDSTDSEDSKQSGNRSTNQSGEPVKIPSHIMDKINDELHSLTDSAFTASIESLSDTKTDIKYVKFCTDFHSSFVIPYKTILDETTMVDGEYNVVSYTYNPTEAYNTFKNNMNRSISFLLKEFEMKKAASQYKRNKVSKTGSLDMSKIWGYKLNDDLFKQISTTTGGKSHGMIFLLDWSGSMCKVIHDAIEQVITLSAFCHRAQIPFQVLAFTTLHKSEERYKFERSLELADGVIDNHKECQLFEFFNHKMSTREFNTMAKRLFLTSVFTSMPQYKLSTTPLTSGLSYMVYEIDNFIRKNNIEKFSFITVTDGDSSSIRLPYKTERTQYKMVDEKTKITYDFSRHASEQIDVMLDMIKKRYDASIISYYIGKNSHGSMWEACRANLIKGNHISQDEYKRQIKEYGMVKLSSEVKENFIYIPSTSLRIKEDELEVDPSRSAKVIAKSFTRMLENRSISRPFLQHFIDKIA